MSSLVGRVVGDYRLDSLIGTGNLGAVYQATRTSDNQPFAVKVVHDRFSSDPGFPDRFQRVVGAASRLRHQNIVRIESFGSTQGEYFIAMQLLARGSLRTMMERREDRLTLQRAVELMKQTADALASAHASGVVHRDVKPENIMLARSDASGTPSSTVCMVDFGMMQLIDTGVTVVGQSTPGSPKYMSPEQCSGRPLDARSDIYSFGIVLYEAATGYPPFQIQTFADAIEKHLTIRPAPPRSVNSTIPPELERIILQCLEKKPEDRYQSAQSLATDLQHVQNIVGVAKGPRVVVEGTPPRHEGARVVLAPEQGDQHIRVRMADDARKPDAPRPQNAPPAASEGDRIKVHMGGAGTGVPTPKAPAMQEGDRIKVQMPGAPGVKPPKPAASAPKAPSKPAESRLIKFSIDRPILTLIPGQPTAIRATLFNGAKIVDHFNVAVEGVPANWVQLPAAPPQLNPGDRTSVNFTINVPKIPDSHARTYQVTVRVTALRQTSETASVACEWTVTPFVTASVALTPSRARAWRRATFGVRVKNDGNTSARYKLVANDDEAVLAYRFGEQEVTLGPGDAANLKMDVRSRSRWIGTTESRTFMVRAEPLPNADGSPPVPQTSPIAPGQYLHRAMVPLWAPPLMILLAAGIWFFWLKDRGKIQLALTPPAAMQVAIGATAPVKAQVTDVKKGAAIDSLSKQVKFVVDDSTIAAINDSGVVRGKKLGSTVLTASIRNIKKTLQVEVVAAQVTTLALAPSQLNLVVGGRGRLTAQPHDALGNALKRDVSWMSSNPTVAVVTGDGTVIASDTGIANVTAMSEGHQANAVVTVKANAEMIAKAKNAGTGGDCTSYDPATLKIVHDKQAGWLISDGTNSFLTLDDELDARHAMALARGYKTHCFLGRTNRRPNRSSFVIEYWLNPSGAPIVIDNEDCVPFSPTALKVVDNQQQGFALMDGKKTVLFADTRDDAQKIWEVAQQHNQQCFIGRGNRRQNQRDYVVQYWR